MKRRTFSHFSGCLLGGAIGDALGAPIEFMPLTEIRRRFGPSGITNYPEIGPEHLAEFTDDTQMTLFTAEGLIVARRRGQERGIWGPVGSIHRAYLRWLRTQEQPYPSAENSLSHEGWLLKLPALWKIKAPGSTCLSALRSGQFGTVEKPLNHSKGCGGVMRVAPVGLLKEALGVPPGDPANAFDMAVQAAALTHGHPSGYLSAGVLGQVIAELVEGQNLEEAVQSSLHTLTRWTGHEETLLAVHKAIAAAHNPELQRSPETVERLGEGWVAEEALSISLYCAMAHPTDFTAGILLAVNHSGDSDSTGSICGNLLGLLLGREAIAPEWLEKIELRGEIDQIARNFLE